MFQTEVKHKDYTATIDRNTNLEPYIFWTHFDIFVVGDYFRGECVVADDGLVLNTGEDDATLATGWARVSAVGGCACTACARRCHCYCRTRCRIAWAAFDITISYRTYK